MITEWSDEQVALESASQERDALHARIAEMAQERDELNRQVERYKSSIAITDRNFRGMQEDRDHWRGVAQGTDDDLADATARADAAQWQAFAMAWQAVGNLVYGEFVLARAAAAERSAERLGAALDDIAVFVNTDKYAARENTLAMIDAARRATTGDVGPAQDERAVGFREAIDAVAKMADETAAAWDETRDGKIHPTIAGSFRRLASWARSLPAPAPNVSVGNAQAEIAELLAQRFCKCTARSGTELVREPDGRLTVRRRCSDCGFEISAAAPKETADAE